MSRLFTNDNHPASAGYPVYLKLIALLKNARIVSALLIIMAGVFIISIFILVTTGNFNFFLIGNNIRPNYKLLVNFLPGWGHLFLNASGMIALGIIELRQQKNWSYFIILVGTAWIATFDLLATRLYINILPTPIFPGACLFLSLWISRDKIFFPKKIPFNELSLKAKLGVLYGLSLFTLGVISLLGAINHKFIPVNFSYSGNEKSLLLAVEHVAGANLSGYGLVVIYISKLEEQFKNQSLSALITISSALSFFILLTASILERTLLFYFFIPMCLIVLSFFSNSHFFSK